MSQVSLYERLKRALSRQRQKSRALRRRTFRVGRRSAGVFADLSSNNGLITSGQFREYAKGHNMVAIKATEGTNYLNPYFAVQVKMAHDEGLLVMPYHFARPDANPSPSGARAEARLFVDACRRAGVNMGPRRRFWFRRRDLPGCLDYETAHPSRGDQVWEAVFTNEYRTETNHGVTAWRRVREASATCGPVLYGSNLLRERFTGLLSRLLWDATYGPAPVWPPAVPSRLRFAWQYSDAAKVGLGVSDASRLFCSVSDLVRIAV